MSKGYYTEHTVEKYDSSKDMWPELQKIHKIMEENGITCFKAWKGFKSKRKRTAELLRELLEVNETRSMEGSHLHWETEHFIQHQLEMVYYNE